MPFYDVNCQVCGVQETFARMSTSGFADCPVCLRPRPKGITLPNFTEDRLRFWKGPMGNGYSTALGTQMPETTRERDRMAKERGIEFCSKEDLLNGSKEAAEAYSYAESVKAGGPREEQPAPTTASFVPKPAWASGLGV